ncbi:MAG: biopolymer transporter Tol [Halothece sp. Uz-M2-17]|mgnify:CR=1 FL=1|nr:biopolymer transporter Tol [Halothece sp. Uz-M2-17]
MRMIRITGISLIIKQTAIWKRWLSLSFSIGLLSLLSACGSANVPTGTTGINSRYNDQEPSLSGNGRYLAWVSNRNGRHQVLLYDLSREQYVPLPGLNPKNVLTESPSLSRTGRYLVFLVSREGRPEIALYDRIVEETEILTDAYRYWVRNPDIDLDGRYIVFETARRGQWDVEVLDRGPEVEPDILDGTRIYGNP